VRPGIHDTTLAPGAATALDHRRGRLASARFLQDAQRASEEDIGFVCHDVTQEPFPTAPAEVFFCRFLLTHLTASPRASSRPIQ
jgi:hypothetical protein